MTTLDEDTRHSERNEQAKQRAADQLRPAIRRALAEILEIGEDELGEYRDATKEVMRSRQRREERKNQTIMEAIKWAVGLGLGGLGTWIVTNHGGGK